MRDRRPGARGHAGDRAGTVRALGVLVEVLFRDAVWAAVGGVRARLTAVCSGGCCLLRSSGRGVLLKVLVCNIGLFLPFGVYAGALFFAKRQPSCPKRNRTKRGFHEPHAIRFACRQAMRCLSSLVRRMGWAVRAVGAVKQALVWESGNVRNVRCLVLDRRRFVRRRISVYF